MGAPGRGSVGTKQRARRRDRPERRRVTWVRHVVRLPPSLANARVHAAPHNIDEVLHGTSTNYNSTLCGDIASPLSKPRNNNKTLRAWGGGGGFPATTKSSKSTANEVFPAPRRHLAGRPRSWSFRLCGVRSERQCGAVRTARSRWRTRPSRLWAWCACPCRVHVSFGRTLSVRAQEGVQRHGTPLQAK